LANLEFPVICFHFYPLSPHVLSPIPHPNGKKPQKTGKIRIKIDFLAEFRGFLPFFGLHFSPN